MAQLDKLRGALFGACIGDALAMPVHWYYDLRQLKRDFGSIQKYEVAVHPFPNTILSKSGTGTGGRGPDTGEIVDKVICHGKRKFWARGTSYHYHHGLEAGENTLDLMVMRALLRDISSNGGINLDSISQSYIDFMTTPGSHNDVYASTAHRMFFRNYVINKKNPVDCPDNDRHNVDAIDGLINAVPIILKGLIENQTEKQVMKDAYDVMLRYRNAPNMRRYINEYVHLCFMAYNAGSFQELAQQANVEVERMKFRRDPMTACYIDSSFPALLHFVYKYGGQGISTGLLASANAGGENVARGISLGFVLGLLHGYESIEERFVSGLIAHEEIQEEFEGLVGAFTHCADDEM